MRTYNYREAIRDDIREYIHEEIELAEWVGSREGLEEKLYDELWIYDGVTGNASGSYTFNRWQAEENLCHNWDLLADALEEFGQDDVNVIEKGAEWADVTIRCYLLGECIAAVLDEFAEQLDGEPEEIPQF